MSVAPRFEAAALVQAAAGIFAAAGVEEAKARVMAEVLVESDLMGHVTHGLGLMPKYMEEITSGRMRKEGEPEVLSDHGAAITWDGRSLPGGWLTMKALDLAAERARQHGTCSIAIARSQHIGCLAVYPARAAERGLVCLLFSSAPGTASVAPFGAKQGVYSPNPFAAGYPTGEAPVVTDISASITTNNMSLRLAGRGERFPEKWLLDAEGNPTDDPNAIKQGGTILPAGGLDHGQKGYGWALVTEALTQGLPGYGRADGDAAGMMAGVFLQVIDPEAFAGLGAFTRQTSHTAAACRAAAPRPGLPPVRLPGQKGLKLREAALAGGVELAPGILEALRPIAAQYSVELPAPLAG